MILYSGYKVFPSSVVFIKLVIICEYCFVKFLLWIQIHVGSLSVGILWSLNGRCIHSNRTFSGSTPVQCLEALLMWKYFKQIISLLNHQVDSATNQHEDCCLSVNTQGRFFFFSEPGNKVWQRIFFLSHSMVWDFFFFCGTVYT